ncbi:class I SAM-dependent methyltransferase [Salinarimonas soli]|uniref:Class I SAM-dependent methyltransferase n=1 Tax=Salinarimonas soli TaxID=1638099 RepID=A0A5B2V8X0_9HYPH|nr:class I SAM-dependent methyltransferase [Salinarimonas soli]KAA2234832.1 class I SAM-dependent methyltransferase [Salinarimonas soli]
MIPVRTLAAALLASAIAAGSAAAQTSAPAATPYVPQVGQQGKDVVWVPTHEALIERMLGMAQVTPADYLIDLGSGDGRTVIAAAKRGVKALGIEYNPDLVALSKQSAEKEGVADKASFVHGDIFQTDFTGATVLTLFLLPDLNRRLRPTILEMKPGTRVVSNTFDMGEWTPDQTVSAEGACTSYCRAHKWIVPAKVGGTWRMGEGELALTQTFQMLSGTLKTGDASVPVTEARMNGEEIAFKAGDRVYTGRVSGGRMEGRVQGGGAEGAWNATRAGS